jgi:predicted Zn-ribbon and HTH transcriptional regulator
MKSRTCFKKNGEPRSVYSSLVEAKCAAAHEKSVRGVELVPYRCNDCGEYHNSPKDRVTPSKTCPHCNKDLYETSDAARRRAAIIYKTRGIKLMVYPCPYKLGSHLTKKTKKG